MRIAGKALSPDDVVLLPQYSDIETRKTVELAQIFFHARLPARGSGLPLKDPTRTYPISLKYPLVSSNMDTITEYETAKAMSKVGGAGILHRYKSPELIKQWVKALKEERCIAIPSIGVKPGEADLAKEYFYECGADTICIDVAHGDHKLVFNTVKELSEIADRLIVGNVVTLDAATRIADLGVTILKVGIGNGSICSTRVMTGHGLPQITALFDVSQVKRRYPKVKLISDGGVKNSGDCVKVLAAGADIVMSGSLFAGCRETPCVKDGKRVYRGMASREARQAFYGSDYQQVAEGESFENIPEKGSVIDVVEELVMGIKSGLSYSGANSLEELHRKAIFYEVTPAGFTEGTPHYKLRV